MPRVTVLDSSPMANPIATTSSPTLALFTEPSVSVGCCGSGSLTCSTARSAAVDTVMTRAA
jgi:hypothetical protein